MPLRDDLTNHRARGSMLAYPKGPVRREHSNSSLTNVYGYGGHLRLSMQVATRPRGLHRKVPWSSKSLL